MRKTLFETIFNEEFINVDIEKAELIGKLIQLQNIGINDDTDGRELAFYINKRGSFSVNTPQRGGLSPARNYILEGKVIASKNNTSIIYMKQVYIRSWLLGIIALLITILLPAILSFGLTWKLLFFIPFFIVPFLLGGFISSHEGVNKISDFEIMKKEVLKRIEAVENWDK